MTDTHTASGPGPISPVRCTIAGCPWAVHGIPDRYVGSRNDFLRRHLSEDHKPTQDDETNEPEPADPVHDELSRHLDWSFWGTGMADVFREPLAEAMLAGITPEQRQQANHLITRWRGHREFVGRDKYEAQKAEIESLRAQLAEQRDQVLTEASEYLERIADEVEAQVADHYGPASGIGPGSADMVRLAAGSIRSLTARFTEES